MSLHIYAFGSLCRGEIDLKSDVDLLVLTDSNDNRFNPDVYSIYSYKRISELWFKGNPFAWHLATESRMLYSSDELNYIQNLGLPKEYIDYNKDCKKFLNLYCKAAEAIKKGGNSIVFEMSIIFLAIRNFATCFLLGKRNVKNFSRHAALQIDSNSLPISKNLYSLLEQSRILSIRGEGRMITYKDIEPLTNEIKLIKEWMDNLLKEE